MEYYEGQHKDRSLKDCMLLVAQRLTKYPVLVEQVCGVVNNNFFELEGLWHKN